MSQANALAESASLLAKVKALDNQRSELKEQIEEAKRIIEKQKLEAELISALMKRSELPSLEETRDKLQELNNQIEETRQLQRDLQEESRDLQTQIDRSIAIREKRAKYEKLYSEVKVIMNNYEAEKAREKELKLNHSQLSSELLKNKYAKRQIEQQLAAEVEPPPDLEPLQRKKQSLIDQTRLVQNKREIFTQELADALERHQAMVAEQQRYNEMAEKVDTKDPLDIQRQVLEMAATNLDLHQFKQLDPEIASRISQIRKLTEHCDMLITKANEIIEDY